MFSSGSPSYVNPLNLACDLPSAMFHYLVLHPDVIANRQETFFSGSLKSQASRFGKFVTKMCLKHQNEIQMKYGFQIRDIGVHSWRKGAHTKLNTGSTGGPSGAAACIRGGHTIGGSKDVYIAQEKASDTFCGRILQGLPEHAPEFAVSYPDFVPIEAIQCLTGGVSEEDYGAKQAEVNGLVMQALQSIFGPDHLNKNPDFIPILRIGLASHLIHYDSYDRPLDIIRPELGKLVPDRSPLRRTTLFTTPMITALKEHVRIAMPWQKHYRYFKPATGLPPHVLMYAYIRDVQQDVNDIPRRLEELLDSRQMLGGVPINQITDRIINAVENGAMLRSLTRDVATIMALVRDGGGAP